MERNAFGRRCSVATVNTERHTQPGACGWQGGRLGVDDKHFAGERFKFDNTPRDERDTCCIVPDSEKFLSRLAYYKQAAYNKWGCVGVCMRE